MRGRLGALSDNLKLRLECVFVYYERGVESSPAGRK